ncbi:MAG: NYN domain-containing protein [Desulfobacteria bacterium]
MQKAFPQYISKDPPPPALDKDHRTIIERFPSIFVNSIKNALNKAYLQETTGPGVSISIGGNTITSRVRYIKAHSEWSFLPLASEIQLLALARSVGILPHQSHAREFRGKSSKVIKEASDRALILKVVEDLFLRKTVNVDSVIIGSGDIGFVPLIEFLIEHTNLNVGLVSVGSHVLSKELKQFVESNFGPNSVHVLDQDEAFKLYYDECKGKLAVKKEEVQELPLVKDETETVIEKIKDSGVSDVGEDGKENTVYTKLIIGLLRSSMPFVSRGHFVNKWVHQNKRGYLDGLNNDDIVDAMIEKEIIIEKERGNGITEIILNQDNEFVKEIKKSILKL